MSNEIRREKKSMRKSGIVIQHTPRSSMGGGGYMTTTSTMRRGNVMGSGYGGGAMLPSGEASNLSKQAVQTVKGVRGKEKQEMCNLNGRLASYLEKVKFLEATNKALSEECAKLRKIKGITGDRIRDEYQEELKEAQESLLQTQKETAPLESKILSLEDKVESLEDENDELRKIIDDLRCQLDKLNGSLSEQEAETLNLRRQCEGLAKERDNWKKEAKTLRLDNTRLRNDLEAARAAQVATAHENDDLCGRIAFIEKVTDEEIRELRELLDKLKSIQPHIEEMWKSEFGNTISELQQHFDEQLRQMEEDQQQRYDEKLCKIQANQQRDNTDSASMSEVRNLRSSISDLKRQLDDLRGENDSLRRQLSQKTAQHEMDCKECDRDKDQLRNEIALLKAELEDISAAMEELQSSKMDLDLEICCYKKLLEGEENKIRSHLETTHDIQSSGASSLAGVISKGISSGGGGGGGGGQSSQSSSMSQSHGKVHVTRSSQCGVQVVECDQAGHYVVLHNDTSKEFSLKDWSVTRSYKKRGEAASGSYKFGDFVLKAKKVVKVYSQAGIEDFEYDQKDKTLDYTVFLGNAGDCKSFGSGNGVCKLLNPAGQKKASSEMQYVTE